MGLQGDSNIGIKTPDILDRSNKLNENYVITALKLFHVEEKETH
ncbi:MAG: hypothetical protein ACYCUZ_02960 [Cuniculiplasma sp.]|jgi:hypothetical protein